MASMEDTAGPLSPAALMVAPLGMVGTLLESSVLVAPVSWCLLKVTGSVGQRLLFFLKNFSCHRIG